MPIFIDQMLREVEINTKPQRIISLVPSQTELLFDLGLDNEVIGITKFCIHPKHWLKEKNIVGGTKKLNLKKIEALKPDLIIGNKEENSKEDIEILMQKFPVWMSDINNLAQALQMIESIATITHKTQHGMLLNNKIKE
jgi:ABC-type Fe3+-hydroxamate transport system substrate-binding protein